MRPMDPWLSLVVVGAHLRGQPLNHELTSLGAEFVRACRTARVYSLHALPGRLPKPGLVREAAGGSAFDVEVWRLPRERVGDFIAGVRAPLCIGSVELDDETSELGFLCEAYAVIDAEDISAYRGWLAYRSAVEGGVTV